MKFELAKIPSGFRGQKTGEENYFSRNYRGAMYYTELSVYVQKIQNHKSIRVE